jgi:hypothetical protein
MFYERKVTSFPELVKGLRALDQDAGVRVAGVLRDKKVLVFVTRFGPKYTLMAYAVRKGTPGERVQTLEFEDFGGLEQALRGFVHGRLHAWIY